MKYLRKIGTLLGKERMLPIISGVASGTYPWLFYFTNNYSFVNSWSHFWAFLGTFIFLPTAIYTTAYFVLRKKYLNLYTRFILPLLNALFFLYFALLAIYGSVSYKKMAALIVASLVVATACWYIKNLFSKILVIQFLLIFTTLYPLASIAKKYVKTSSDSWLEQPDNIADVVLKQTPNIYLIQPDGYINFSELNKGHYQYDNSEFEDWIQSKDFVLYPNYRGNYMSTLSSNTALFSMKHHYYQVWDERKAIMDVNPVIDILKKNNYTTHFFAEKPYLIINRPHISFDYINLDWKDVPFFGRGLNASRDILEDLEPILKNQKGSNFYFFEKLIPGHVTTYKSAAGSKETERESYLKRLEEANVWLKEMITLIEEHDPNGLIVVLADHGGYVGWDYTLQTKIKTTERDLLYSAFSANLLVKWPENKMPDFEHDFISSVNVFRILFAHLSDSPGYLQYVQEDNSYFPIEEGAPKGVYKVIDGSGNIVFEPIE